MKISVITSTFNELENIKKAKEYWDRQTFKDFEWILADDGSTDDIWEWAKKNGIKIVGNKVNGNYDWSIYNKAAKVAKGEYITWVMGDSYPKEDYLEQLLLVLESNRVVNGIRLNVDEKGIIVSKDWRVESIDEGVDQLRVDWKHMTMNSMAMNLKLYNKIGGILEKYRGYGRADMDLIIKAFLKGAEMWCAPKAVIYHLAHGSREEAEGNIKLFDERFKEFQKEFQKNENSN
jgi:GT2 family glycosyltransferase